MEKQNISLQGFGLQGEGEIIEGLRSPHPVKPPWWGHEI